MWLNFFKKTILRNAMIALFVVALFILGWYLVLG